jgi:hypothetical protein
METKKPMKLPMMNFFEGAIEWSVLPGRKVRSALLGDDGKQVVEVLQGGTK